MQINNFDMKQIILSVFEQIDSSYGSLLTRNWLKCVHNILCGVYELVLAIFQSLLTLVENKLKLSSSSSVHDHDDANRTTI